MAKKQENSYVSIYIQGLPNVETKSMCQLTFDDEYLIIKNIKVTGIFKKKEEILNTFKIKNDKVLSFDIIDKTNIESKKKSVLARGIAGDLVFGPIGAVLGGMSGAKTEIKQINEYFLNIGYYGKDKNDIKTIIFRAGFDDRFARDFVQKYNNKFLIKNTDINENGEIIL